MKKVTGIAGGAVLASGGLLLFCLHGGAAPAANSLLKAPASLPAIQIAGEPIQPIPPQMNLDERKVALGRKLFHETQISGDNTVSCATCHDLAKAGTDRKPRSVGIRQQVVAVNAPTVLNSTFNYKQFWNARAATLEDQADGPPQAAKEMGSTWPEIIARLKQNPEYVAAFKTTYSEGLNHDTVCNAIAVFERTLTTPNGRFDRYLRGETTAITEEEKQGYHLFKNYGCSSCHQGVNVGGNMLAKFGVMANYLTTRGNITEADFGRYNVTKNEADRYYFKVPGLRNVTQTAPYFHDGSVATLDIAVTVMARYQLGRSLDADELHLIVKFLGTLEGDPNGGKP